MSPRQVLGSGGAVAALTGDRVDRETALLIAVAGAHGPFVAEYYSVVSAAQSLRASVGVASSRASLSSTAWSKETFRASIAAEPPITVTRFLIA